MARRMVGARFCECGHKTREHAEDIGICVKWDRERREFCGCQWYSEATKERMALKHERMKALGPLLVGMAEAALLLEVDRQTVHNYASRGILPVALKVGKIRYYRKCDVLELKERRGKGFAKGRGKQIPMEGVR